jgi:hypothetical protein
MVSDQQVKRLWLLVRTLSLEVAAAKAGMDPKTVWKYLRDRRLAERDAAKAHLANTAESLVDTWEEIRQLLIAEHFWPFLCNRFCNHAGTILETRGNG